jgi:hypothetical protein
MVRIDSGIDPHAKLDEVPQSRWRELLDVRRISIPMKLTTDCRRLIEIISDAQRMHSVCGFATADELIEKGLGLKIEQVEAAVRWLRSRLPDYPIPYDVAVRLAGQGHKPLPLDNPLLAIYKLSRTI